MCQNKHYQAGYALWSDLVFSFFTLQLHLHQTLDLSEQKLLKEAILPTSAKVAEFFQSQLSAESVLQTFMNNASDAKALPSHARYITWRILSEALESQTQQKELLEPLVALLSLQEMTPFTMLQTDPPVKSPSLEDPFSILSANLICFPGTLPYLYGGIRPWKERINPLLDLIKKADAHVVCLQEIWDPEAMRALIEGLKDHYTSFIYNVGDPAGTLHVENMGFNIGLFVASQIPLDKAQFHRFGRCIPQGSNRGALLWHCQMGPYHATCLNTHLQHGNTPVMQEVRREQLLCAYALLLERIGNSTKPSWGCIAGDLNIDGLSSEYQTIGLTSLFALPAVQLLVPTCTNYFNDLVLTPLSKRAGVVKTQEALDYCAQPTSLPFLLHSEQKIIPLFQLDAPLQALSDHHALLTKWDTNRSPPKLNQ